MPQSMWIPPLIGMGTNVTYATSLEDSTSDLVGWAFMPEEDATVESVLIFLYQKTGSPGMARIGFQGCSATTGLNDGVWQSYVDTDMSTVGAGSIRTFTLGTTQNVYRGQTICIVIQPLSGTWNASNSISISWGRTNAYPYNNLPYAFANTTGTTAKISTRGYVTYGYRSSTKTYGTPFTPGLSGTWNVNSTNNEYGIQFTLPETWGKTFTLIGINATHRFISGSGSNATFNLNLYDAASNLLAQRSFNSNEVMIPTSSLETTYQFLFDESTLPTLSYGSQYIVAMHATNTVDQRYVQTVVFAAGDWSAVTDAEYVQASRANGGAWGTNSLLSMNWQLMIQDTTSGGVTYAGMTGGMRG